MLAQVISRFVQLVIYFDTKSNHNYNISKEGNKKNENAATIKN